MSLKMVVLYDNETSYGPKYVSEYHDKFWVLVQQIAEEKNTWIYDTFVDTDGFILTDSASITGSDYFLDELLPIVVSDELTKLVKEENDQDFYEYYDSIVGMFKSVIENINTDTLRVYCTFY